MFHPTAAAPYIARRDSYLAALPSSSRQGLHNIVDSLDRYILEGIPTGGFLESVLANDLTGAWARADAQNTLQLKLICEFVYSVLPSRSHGSYQQVRLWLNGET